MKRQLFHSLYSALYLLTILHTALARPDSHPEEPLRQKRVLKRAALSGGIEKRYVYYVWVYAKTCAFVQQKPTATSSGAITSQEPFYCYGEFCGFSGKYAGCVSSSTLPTTCLDYTPSAYPCGTDYEGCPLDTTLCTESASAFCQTYLLSNTYTAFGCVSSKIPTPQSINGGAFAQYHPNGTFTGIFAATSPSFSTSTSPTSTSRSGLNEIADKIGISVAGVAGIIVGGILFLILLCVAGCCCCAYTKRRAREGQVGAGVMAYPPGPQEGQMGYPQYPTGGAPPVYPQGMGAYKVNEYTQTQTRAL